MKNNPIEFLMNYDSIPKNGDVIIAWKHDGTREQVEIKDGKAYLWRYGITQTIFCDVIDIAKWRGCTGLDF